MRDEDAGISRLDARKRGPEVSGDHEAVCVWRGTIRNGPK